MSNNRHVYAIIIDGLYDEGMGDTASYYTWEEACSRVTEVLSCRKGSTCYPYSEDKPAPVSATITIVYVGTESMEFVGANHDIGEGVVRYSHHTFGGK